MERENRNIKIQNQYLSPLYSDDLDANRVSELETKVKSLEKTSTNAKEEASRLRTAFQLKEKQFTVPALQ